MGLTDGLIRFSIGFDNHIERTYQDMKYCLESLENYGHCKSMRVKNFVNSKLVLSQCI